MIGYVTVGSNDLEKARGFYDALMPAIGASRIMEFGDNFTMYGTGMGKPGFAVCKPHDGNAATAGNGNMASIACDSRAKVDALYAKAMALGGSCEGAAGGSRRGGRAGVLRRLFPRPRRQQARRFLHRPCAASLSGDAGSAQPRWRSGRGGYGNRRQGRGGAGQGRRGWSSRACRGRRLRGSLQGDCGAWRPVADRRRRRRDDQRRRLGAGWHRHHPRHPAPGNAQSFCARPRHSRRPRRSGAGDCARRRPARRRGRDERSRVHQQQRHRTLSVDGRRPRSPAAGGSAEASAWRCSSPRFERWPGSTTSA